MPEETEEIIVLFEKYLEDRKEGHLKSYLGHPDPYELHGFLQWAKSQGLLGLDPSKRYTGQQGWFVGDCEI